MIKEKRKYYWSHLFTLVELLIVIAIIAILMTMLLPALRKAKEKGKESVCKNNLKQINMTYLMYSQENNSSFPKRAAGPQPTNLSASDVYSYGPFDLIEIIQNPYNLNPSVWFCPSHEKTEEWQSTNPPSKATYLIYAGTAPIGADDGVYISPRQSWNDVIKSDPYSKWMRSAKDVVKPSEAPILGDFLHGDNKNPFLAYYAVPHNKRIQRICMDGHVYSTQPSTSENDIKEGIMAKWSSTYVW